MSGFEPELGQAVFSNSPWAEHDAEDHVIAGVDALCFIAAGEDREKLAIFNHGPAGNIDNGTFELRAYCWCDGEQEGHEDGCPPNFRFPGRDFEVRWYKHSSRGASQNRPMPREEWRRILIACLGSLSTTQQGADQ